MSGDSTGSASAQLRELLSDLRELESLYDTDRIASGHARQIERIFDKWLHENRPELEAALGAVDVPTPPEKSKWEVECERLATGLMDTAEDWLSDAAHDLGDIPNDKAVDEAFHVLDALLKRVRVDVPRPAQPLVDQELLTAVDQVVNQVEAGRWVLNTGALGDALEALCETYRDLVPSTVALCADEPQCTGPFSDAFDCPVHDPRKRVAQPPEEKP